MKKKGLFEKLLARLADRMTKQLEENMKETERLRRIHASYEDMDHHFQDSVRLIRNNLKKDIDKLFRIDRLKESLKDKSITPELKKSTWSDLKNELILYPAFSMVYLPLAEYILFINECLILKKESKTENMAEKDLFVLETFLKDFNELIIRESGKKIFSAIQAKIEPIVSLYEATKKYSAVQIINLFRNISKALTELIVDESKRALSKKDSSQDIDKNDLVSNPSLDFMGEFANMLVNQNKNSKNKKNTGNQLTLPRLRVSILQEITSRLENLQLLGDEKIIKKYYVQAEEEIRLRPADNEILAIENSIQEQPVSIKKEVNEKETRSNIESIVNEYLDLIESTNFNLLILYSIIYEFKKLENRLLFYFAKNNLKDGILLATFLPALQKITNEEFLDENCDENNDKFCNSKIKSAFSYVHSKEISEDAHFVNLVLEEIEMKKYVETAAKDFGKRIFMGSEFIKFFDNNPVMQDDKALKEGGDLEQFLNVFAGSHNAKEGV